MKQKKNYKLIIVNIFFVLGCAAILIFLINAPEESTSPLPLDETHSRFHEIEGKKEAEKFCLDCHEQDKEAPLPEGHPAKYRCLFCHKRS